MARIELTLKQTYRPHWRRPEAVREFVQNWLDGHDKGFTRSLRWEKGCLVLRNDDVVLPRESLLLGFTSKATDDSARGQWGEGLDMGLLVATRDGLDVVVHTGTERWTPKLVRSASFEDEVLAIFTRQVRDCKGTEVHLRLTEDEWDHLCWRFLDLKPTTETMEGSRGRILFDEDRRACVYVKGIFVSRVDGLQYGYDFADAKVDVDRMLVHGFDVQWESAYLWTTAVSRDPVQNGRVVWEMLKAEHKDVEGLGDRLQSAPNPKVAEAIACMFKADHGEQSLPAVDDGQMQRIEHLGRTPVRVSKMAGKVLEAHYGPFHAMLNEVSRQEKTVVGLGSLTGHEYQVVMQGLRWVEMALDGLAWSRTHRELLGGLEVVEYQDEKILGTWERSTRRIGISRSVLRDVPEFLGTYIHELAHELTESGDGWQPHVSAVEMIWVHCLRVVHSRLGGAWLDE